jgi:hypothetical protein
VHPHRRWLVLALVSVAGLIPFHHVADQDRSRFCLTRALLHGRLDVGDCIDGSIDKSSYHGRLYSNKAPGMSIAAVPAYAIAAAVGGESDHGLPGGRWIWFLRIATAGVAFVVAVAVLARLGEGLVPGTGVTTAAAFGVGTLALPFAATAYDHLPAAALLISAFWLATRRRCGWAGLAAGAAVLVEYQSAVAWLILLLYTSTLGLRRTQRYVFGSVPPLAVLAAYGWAAFGAPWRNPLSYSANRYEADHATGLLGIHAPTLHGLRLVFIGDKGLLVTSPLLIAAAAGLVLLWRQGKRPEAVVCGSIAAAYLLAESGYFDPYNGFSPGPRYVIPALPFLCLGLGPALRTWPRATWALVGISLVSTVAITLTWALGSDAYTGSIWPQVAHVATGGRHAQLLEYVAPAILPVPHAKLVDTVVVAALAAGALVAAAGLPRTAGRFPRRRHPAARVVPH